MAEMLVESLTAAFDPTKYEDDYRVQVLDLIAKKAAGEQFELPAAAGEPPKIVDMMAALEASVAAAKEARQRHPTARLATGAKRPGETPRTAEDGLAPELPGLPASDRCVAGGGRVVGGVELGAAADSAGLVRADAVLNLVRFCDR